MHELCKGMHLATLEMFTICSIPAARSVAFAIIIGKDGTNVSTFNSFYQLLRDLSI